jgi:hypothetical protein
VRLTAALRQLGPSQRKILWDADEQADAVARLERQRKFDEAMILAHQTIEARKAVLGSKHCGWPTPCTNSGASITC